MRIDTRALENVDLNLLVSAEVLFRETNLGRAAKALGITQPAASQRLARLRDLFGDPLLVRRGGRMVLTPFAEGLRTPLQRVLAEVHAVVRRVPAFDPAASERRFVIATTDMIASVLFPGLFARILASAKGIGIDAKMIDTPRYDVDLERTHDLALGVFQDRPGVIRRRLFTDDFSCIARRGHPLLTGRLTMKRFVAFPHVLVSPSGAGPGPVDTALAEHGLARHVVLRIAAFAMAPPVLEATPAIMTLPSRLARQYAARYRLALFSPPIALHRFDVYAAWNARSDGDPGLRWLIERIEDVARTV